MILCARFHVTKFDEVNLKEKWKVEGARGLYLFLSIVRVANGAF